MLKALAETHYLKHNDKGYAKSDKEEGKNEVKESKSSNVNNNNKVTNNKDILACTALGEITNVEVQDV